MTAQFKSGIVKLCCLFAIFFISLQSYALQPVPALLSPVTDLTQTLSSQEQLTLANKLKQLSNDKGSQIAVLIVSTTQPEEIDQYSIRVADEWKIGREKEDDGVIIVVARDDRKMRIEVGYGLEGAIPDVYAKRIINEVMGPRFKQGDFYGGINAAVDRINGLISGENLPSPQIVNTVGRGLFELLPLIMFVAVITGMILRSMFGTFIGSALNGGLIGGLVWMFGAALFAIGLAAIAGFIFTLMMGSRGVNGYGNYPGNYRGGGFGNGGFGGGGFGGGGFGGGGGGFGGGGASGSW